MIKIENIRKIFRNGMTETLALDGASIEIKQGEFVAIMGPSGCGKSTLLNIIGLLDSFDEGRYYFYGKDVSNLSDKEMTLLRRGTIGFVFQSFNLIDELTVEENVELPLKYLKMTKSERKVRVNELLKRLAVSHRSSHYPQQLSGGQQQRVAIARAIAGLRGEGLLLADEPTGNLDSANGVEVMKLLKEMNKQGVTIVMATHSQRDACYADRIINLLDGQVFMSPL